MYCEKLRTKHRLCREGGVLFSEAYKASLQKDGEGAHADFVKKMKLFAEHLEVCIEKGKTKRNETSQKTQSGR